MIEDTCGTHAEDECGPLTWRDITWRDVTVRQTNVMFVSRKRNNFRMYLSLELCMRYLSNACKWQPDENGE